MKNGIIRYSGFSGMLEGLAERLSEKTALIYEADGEKRTMSFAGLYSAVTGRARELKNSGKTSVGVLCDGSIGCVLTIFGANLAGMQTVLLDPAISVETLSRMIDYTDVDMLFGDAELCSRLEGSLTGGVKDGRGKLLFFTSGTTEAAKAVVLTDESLCNSAYNGSVMLPLSEDDVLLSMLPLCHVFGFVCSLLWGLSCGAAVALGRGMRHWLDDWSFFRPTAVSVVPAMLGFF